MSEWLRLRVRRVWLQLDVCVLRVRLWFARLWLDVLYARRDGW